MIRRSAIYPVKSVAPAPCDPTYNGETIESVVAYVVVVTTTPFTNSLKTKDENKGRSSESSSDEELPNSSSGDSDEELNEAARLEDVSDSDSNSSDSQSEDDNEKSISNSSDSSSEDNRQNNGGNVFILFLYSIIFTGYYLLRFF